MVDARATRAETVQILDPVRRPAPMQGPLLVDVLGRALLPHPAGGRRFVELRQGLTLGWMPIPKQPAVLLSIADMDCRAEPLATTLTRAGLRGLIADLQSIDAQLEELD